MRITVSAVVQKLCGLLQKGFDTESILGILNSIGKGQFRPVVANFFETAGISLLNSKKISLEDLDKVVQMLCSTGVTFYNDRDRDPVVNHVSIVSIFNEAIAQSLQNSLEGVAFHVVAQGQLDPSQVGGILNVFIGTGGSVTWGFIASLVEFYLGVKNSNKALLSQTVNSYYLKDILSGNDSTNSPKVMILMWLGMVPPENIPDGLKQVMSFIINNNWQSNSCCTGGFDRDGMYSLTVWIATFYSVPYFQFLLCDIDEQIDGVAENNLMYKRNRVVDYVMEALIDAVIYGSTSKFEKILEAIKTYCFSESTLESHNRREVATLGREKEFWLMHLRHLEHEQSGDPFCLKLRNSDLEQDIKNAKKKLEEADALPILSLPDSLILQLNRLLQTVEKDFGPHATILDGATVCKGVCKPSGTTLSSLPWPLVDHIISFFDVPLIFDSESLRKPINNLLITLVTVNLNGRLKHIRGYGWPDNNDDDGWPDNNDGDDDDGDDGYDDDDGDDDYGDDGFDDDDDDDGFDDGYETMMGDE